MSHDRIHTLVTTLGIMTATVLASCSDHDNWGGDDPQHRVKAQLTFALPRRIVVGGQLSGQTTRMSQDIVQLEQSTATFRGLDNVKLLTFTGTPTETSRSTTDVIQLYGTAGRTIDVATTTDYSIVRQIEVPVGTDHFGFYAQAIDNAYGHDDYVRYGMLRTSGLDTYSGNSNISFAHVAICPSAENQGGSEAGQVLVTLLNKLMTTTGPEPAPNNLWSTSNDEYLQETYRAMTALTTLSSDNVQRFLGKIYKMLSQLPDEYAGSQLAKNISDVIADACETPPTPGSETLKLQEKYRGFPADIHLPAGAARIEWNASANTYQTPALQDYGRGLAPQAMTDYVYPANLQYTVFSDVVASDSLALPAYQPVAGRTDSTNVNNPSGTTAEAQTDTMSTASYKNWAELIDKAYADGYSEVKATTQSVAMVKQVQYAVGRVDTRVNIQSSTLYDAYGKAFNALPGFTLKGIIIGGQRQVGYDFEPKADAHDYAIYDTAIDGGPQHVTPSGWTDYNYTLCLPTTPGRTILVALELLNHGADFQGADGLIAHGAIFYLTAALVPSEASNYRSGSLDRIVIGDHNTRVDMRIMTGNRDVNGDGVPDTDANNDGIPDTYVMSPAGVPLGIDVDGDGIIDNHDANRDGLPDKIVTLDTNGDGVIDRVGWDTNNDGTIDIAINPDADGHWPTTPTKPTGLATATYGIPNLTTPDVVRTFGLSVDLSWRRGITFDDVQL